MVEITGRLFKFFVIENYLRDIIGWRNRSA